MINVPVGIVLSEGGFHVTDEATLDGVAAVTQLSCNNLTRAHNVAFLGKKEMRW